MRDWFSYIWGASQTLLAIVIFMAVASVPLWFIYHFLIHPIGLPKVDMWQMAWCMAFVGMALRMCTAVCTYRG